ncbi:hypothetical protein ACQY0O_001297 [Thecaphora frezii]
MGLPPRQSLTVLEPPRDKLPPAIHPKLLLVVRFLITGLVCLLSLATCIMCILVVDYYNKHDPIIRPSWGSLIFLIILGLLTPIIYFGYNILLPLMPFIRYGDFLYGLFMVKVELLLQFAMCVLWISGALAYASDLRGRENCQFDGYYHYPKPSDFGHVCDLINYAVPLAYATFGVQVALWAIESLVGAYLFLFLDQESLNEPHFEWGRRAYDYQEFQVAKSMISVPLRTSAILAPSSRAYRDYGRTSPGSLSNVSSFAGSRSNSRNGPNHGEPDMESRHSQPVSLGSRGRRGAAYGGLLEDEESQLGRSDSDSSNGGRGGLAAAAAGGGSRPARQPSSSQKPPRSVDEESGWHLKENLSQR